MLDFAKKIWPYNRSLTGKGNELTLVVDIFSLCDGKNSVLDIPEKIKLPFIKTLKIVKLMKKEKILS